MTTEAPPPVAARARAAAARAADEIVRLGREARPWLRREQWTRENLAALAAAVSRRPRRALAVIGGAAVLLLLLAWALGGGHGDLASAEVREGPFRVSITEEGTLLDLMWFSLYSSIVL